MSQQRRVRPGAGDLLVPRHGTPPRKRALHQGDDNDDNNDYVDDADNNGDNDNGDNVTTRSCPIKI